AALLRPVAASETSSTVTRKRTWRTMPRTASLSGTTTELPMPLSPSARTVARLRAMWLIVLFFWVTRSLPAIGRLRSGHRLTRDVARDLHPAPGRDLLGRVQAAQRLDRRLGDVHGIRGPVDLGQDVVDAGGLDDRTNGAAGDDAGALRRRLE